MSSQFKKYIVWIRNGCEGWTFQDFDTLEEAVNCESYGSEKIITMEVKYKIEEIK